ncbi:MAG: FAD:protein FMN transferase [Sedimentisphaerales bacterium]|nr:FAD:protein FMN transferase [Sedimentisphaerales bacterium]
MQMTIIKRVISIILVLALLLFGSCKDRNGQPEEAGSAGAAVVVDTGRFTLMGTFARIQLRCDSEQVGRQAIESAQAALAEVDRLMSTYREDSELSEINRRGAREPVKVSAETFQILQRAEKFSQISDGAFDITVSPLINLWKSSARENRLPSADELARTGKVIGYEKLILSSPDESRVSFAVDGMKINVNAIAKGYAVDRALAATRKPGVIAGLVDIGGEIACFGSDAPDKPWRVGIQDPFAEDLDNPLSQKARWVIELNDCAIATSGNYRQYITIQGRKFSHIIDPRTGRPADLLPSVTIIAPNTADADALATAVSVMGPEKGLELINSLSQTEGFFITGTNGKPKIYRSDGFAQYEAQL